jgi:uncharacterized protein
MRWETDDRDFLDIVRVDAPADRPRLLLLHGLEGSARSPYALGLLHQAQQRGWGADLLVFRGCGGELNRARRFYHSGETTDLDFVVRRILAEFPSAPLGIAGVSLGGNVLLKWLGEQGASVPARVAGAAAVSVPYDLARAARHIGRGFARVYQWSFLRSLRRKAAAKLERFPDLVARDALDRARTIWSFDDVVTAPIHGFRDASDYYMRSSAVRWIASIRVPTLLLSAVDDPFLPSAVLDDVAEVARSSEWLETEFVARGGHVGFVSGLNPLRPFYYAEWRVVDYLAQRILSLGR